MNQVLIIDAENGRVMRIFIDLFDNNFEDTYTNMMVLPHRKLFLVGNQRGNLGLFNLHSGVKVKELCCHKEAISSINKDIMNNIFITSSQNGIIFAQKEIVYDEGAIDNIIRRKREQLENEMLETDFDVSKRVYTRAERRIMREQIKEEIEVIDNIEKEKPYQIDESHELVKVVRSIELPHSFNGIKKVFTSVYENIIVVISFDGRVDILNYEYMMGVKGIKFPKDAAPLEVTIIQGYRHLLITCSNGMVYVFKFEFYSYSKMKLKMVQKINILKLEANFRKNDT